MFDGEAFGAEIVSHVKSHISKSLEPLISEISLLKARIVQLEDQPPANDGVGLASTFIDREGNLVVTYTDGTVGSVGKVVGNDGMNGKDGRDGSVDESLAVPDEVVAQISKAIALVAESPRIAPRNDPQIVLNMANLPDRSQRTRKTITTRKDENGNMVADVVEW